MNEDIIKWAREAGLAPICSACDEPDVSYAYEDWDEELKKFAALVRADEREACAKVAEDFYYEGPVFADIADAIRERCQA
jgi:hypothetical protein